MNTLKAQKREIVGRKVSKLRSQGLVPANVFGHKVKSLALTLDLKEFLKTYDEAGETGLIEINVGSEKKPALVHNIQFHPVTGLPLHIDFLQVDLKEKVTAQVPVELTGESSAEKQGLGTVVQHTNEVEVKSLPTDIPEKFEIDISTLTEVDQVVYVKDLKYDHTKVEILLDSEQIVVKVEPPKKVEEEAIPAPVIEGAEGEGAEGAPVEGGEEPQAQGDKAPSPKEDKSEPTAKK